MRRFPLVLAALAALTVAGTAQAQARAGGKLGVGVSLDTTIAGVVNNNELVGGKVTMPVMFYVPIQIAPNFRIEPQVGLWTTSNDAEDHSSFALGAGFFLTQPLGQNFDMYAGGRLILDFVGAKDKAAGESGSAVDVSILPAAGVEYMLSPRFSLGFEGQFGYTSQGSITAGAAGRASQSVWGTNALWFLRAYL